MPSLIGLMTGARSASVETRLEEGIRLVCSGGNCPRAQPSANNKKIDAKTGTDAMRRRRDDWRLGQTIVAAGGCMGNGSSRNSIEYWIGFRAADPEGVSRLLK